MNRFGLALLVSLMATTAHAGGSKLSLLQCGLQFGDAQKLSKTYSASEQNRRFGSDQVVRSIEFVLPNSSTFTQTKSNRTVRRRIPPTFTFAKFVCAF